MGWLRITDLKTGKVQDTRESVLIRNEDNETEEIFLPDSVHEKYWPETKWDKLAKEIEAAWDEREQIKQEIRQKNDEIRKHKTEMKWR